MSTVCVLGAGVSGLVTALALSEAGRGVRIVAEKWGADTTSAVAGAIWMPYLCNPPDRVNRWSLETYRWLADLARTVPEAGVDMLTMYESTPDEADPWWRSAVPPEIALELVHRSPLRPGASAWRFPVPRVDPSVCLPWLHAQLQARGVAMHARRINDLAPYLREGAETDLVVNCTGLGARRLCADAEIHAAFGQVVHVEAGEWETTVAAGDESEGVAYVIPRRGVVVIGGCSVEHDPDAPAIASDEQTREILARVGRWGVRHGRVVAQRAGLRPSRSTVRVERDPAEPGLIHNYGHGGAGWTMCRGCANEVVRFAGQSP